MTTRIHQPTLLSYLLTAILTTVALLAPVGAEPFIDNFETLSYIHNDSGTCVFTHLDNGVVQVTNNGERGPKISFGWSNTSFTSTSKLSTNPEDGQSVLEVDGITPAGSSPIPPMSAALMFGDGVGEVTPYKDGNPAFFLPVEPNDKGFWRYDVGKFVQDNFATDDQPKVWAVQFLINTEDQPGAGYNFTTISAVAP